MVKKTKAILYIWNKIELEQWLGHVDEGKAENPNKEWWDLPKMSKTRKMPPLLWLDSQQEEVVIPQSIQWELSQEGRFQQRLGPQWVRLPSGS